MNSRVENVRAELDRKLHLAREEMDRTVQHERHIMDNKLAQERADMELKLQLQRATMDNRLREERETFDKMIKQQRDDMDQKIKEERENLDEKLKHERQAMDRDILLERVHIDSEIMQARVELDKKLQLEREFVDLQIKEEPKHITDMVENEIEPYQAVQDHKPFLDIDTTLDIDMVQNEDIPNDMLHEQNKLEPNLVMEFRVHVVGREFLDGFKYKVSLPYIFRFMKPETTILDWDNLLDHMANVDLRVNCDLYYLKPLSEAPEGLVRMFGSEDMDALLQAHLGLKLCHLYLVDDRFFIYSDDSDGGTDEVIDDGDWCHIDGGMNVSY